MKSDPTPEVRALLIEARRLRSVVANWRSIPPPADVHEEMLDRVMALSTAAGAPQSDWQAWDDETQINEPEPDIPSLMGAELEAHFEDREKTTGYNPSPAQRRRAQQAFDAEEEQPPSSQGSMVLWTPQMATGDVVPPPPPSLGFEPATNKRFTKTAAWRPTPLTPAAGQPATAPAAAAAPQVVAQRPVAIIPVIQDAEIVTAEPTPAQGIERRTTDNRIEVRHPDGRVEVRHLDGRIETQHADGRHEARFSDGRIELRYTDGRIETRYPDGAVETRFADSRVETRFADGRVETRFVDGRIEVRHRDGRIETRWAEAIDRAKAAQAGPPAPPPTHVEAMAIKLPDRIPPDLVLIGDPYSERADAFRALRRKLAANGNPKTIAVMSPNVGEGKTTAALNLVLALRETARGRVLLIEANMRSPSIARMLEFQPPECFVDQMIGHRDEPMKPWAAVEQGGSLHIIAVNPASQRPPLLDPVAFNTAMERLKLAGYEYIVLDTPPVLGSVDANLIADASDGVIMTAWSMKTTKSALTRAVKQLAPAPILGIIMIEG